MIITIIKLSEKQKGLMIISRQNKDRSVDYVLLHIPEQLRKPQEPKYQPQGRWDFSADNARWIPQEELKPTQLEL